MTNMTLATATAEKTADKTANSTSEDLFGRSPSFRQTYHEISEQHVVEADVVEQLRANLAQLEDLHGRLRYAMTEISYLMKRS